MKTTILLSLAILVLASCSRRDADVISNPQPVDFEFKSDPMDTPLRAEYEKAQQLVTRGQIEEAESIYNALRQKEPESTHPLVGLAGCHMVRLAPAPAIALYKQALEINPKSIDAQVGLGAAYLVSDDYDSALAAYAEAQALSPDHPMVQWGLVMTYNHLDRKEVARTHLERFRTLAPNSKQIDKLEQMLKKN